MEAPVSDSRQSINLHHLPINHTDSELGSENEHVGRKVRSVLPKAGERERFVVPKSEKHHVDWHQQAVAASVNETQQSEAEMGKKIAGTRPEADVMVGISNGPVHSREPEIGTYGEMPLVVSGLLAGSGATLRGTGIGRRCWVWGWGVGG